MQNIIAMEVLSAVSENGFSLDELVFKTKELFEEEGLAGFVALILRLIDERICLDLIQGKPRKNLSTCCSQPRYQNLDQLDRKFRTSIGKVMFRWRRLRCQNCGGTIIPLRKFLGLEPYQSKTAELEKMVAEVVSEQSYRRSSSHLDIIGHIPVPKSTAHRWIAQSDCDHINPDQGTFKFLYADGTGYKRRPDPQKNINNRGELKIALGIDKHGRIVPLGAFADLSWDDITDRLDHQLNNKLPLSEMLISDSERGLAKSFSFLCSSQQICHWHVVRELNFTMWSNKASKAERNKTQRDLAAIIGIELPKEDFERVDDKDKADLAEATAKAENDIRKLITSLLDRGYNLAAYYLNRVSKNLFSYVYRWLKTGIVTPRVSMLIERMMREIARRLKRMAFGWSQEGAAKMARIIIKRFTSAGEWEKYWRKRLKINGNVILSLRDIKVVSSQHLGR
jgi:hypothetical protein